MEQAKVTALNTILSNTYFNVRQMVLDEYNVDYIYEIPDERFEDVCEYIQDMHTDITNDLL